MKFGPVAPDEALGAVAVHAVRHAGVTIRKGAIIGADDIAALKRSGVSEVVVARLEPGDISEDEAARRIGAAVCGANVTLDRAATGRANLFAACSGILTIDRTAVDAINRIDPAITLATLEAFKPVVTGEMVATVKIIPFGLPGEACDRAVGSVTSAPIAVAPYRVSRVGIVSTLLPGFSEAIIDKTLKVTAGRLAAAGATIVAERRVAHDQAALAAALEEVRSAGAELIIVFGASAIADMRDVIPAALVAAGGRIEHLGMPVDPGNLMLVGELDAMPVLGAPGCARSPKQNGFDWILTRLLARLPVGRETITAMGVGGLLMEIVNRPQPRVVAAEQGSNVAAIILAAGLSRRMGETNKMLALYDGKPMVRIAAESALASHAKSVVVVTGHHAEAVRAALDGLDVRFVHNSDYEEGLGASVRTGIGAVPPDCDGALICLADMPRVDAALMDRLMAHFAPDRGSLIVVPSSGGRRGNPVLWSRRYFPELLALRGDEGARRLIRQHDDAVTEVPVEGDAAFFDIDTPDALRGAR